jgi:hypothetical protein
MFYRNKSEYCFPTKHFIFLFMFNELFSESVCISYRFCFAITNSFVISVDTLIILDSKKRNIININIDDVYVKRSRKGKTFSLMVRKLNI